MAQGRLTGIIGVMKHLPLILFAAVIPLSADCISDSTRSTAARKAATVSPADDRWNKLLATFDGDVKITSEVVAVYERNNRGGVNHGMWATILAELKCLEAERAAEAAAAAARAEAEADDTPQPLRAEPQTNSVDTTSFRAYVHGGGRTILSEHAWKINEDDHWEAELILHYVSNQGIVLNQPVCVSTDYWGGPDYWHHGPITLPGFDTFVDFSTIPPEHGNPLKGGIWRCTGNVKSNGTAGPNFTVLEDGSTDTEFVYRTTIRTRDNNVVEDDFSIAGDLEFVFNTSFTGQQKHRPETETVPDRAGWRLKRSAEAFPGTHATYCLGTGSAWERKTPLRCGDQVASKYIDRAPVVGGNCDKTHADYKVRANVTDAEWMPDACYPTKDVPKIPPTPDNVTPYRSNPATTAQSEAIPTIEEDDVSYVRLRKVSGKWAVSLSKPVMVTDGPVYNGGNDEDWKLTPDGISLDLFVKRNYTSGAKYTLLIPSTNGIVADKDYVLGDLLRILFPLNTGTRGEYRVGTYDGGTQQDWNYICSDARVTFDASSHGGSHGGGILHAHNLDEQLEMQLPPDGADLCK